MLSTGYGKLVVGCVLGVVVLGGATMALGIGGIADEPAEPNVETVSTNATVTVHSMDVPSTVRSEDPLRVRVHLQNTGSQAKTQEVAVQLGKNTDGKLSNTVATKQVRVPAEDTRTVTLEAAPEKVYPEATTVGVSLADSSSSAMTEDVTVLHPPTFALTDRTVQRSVVRGDNVTVRANITNTGEYRGLQTVRLAVDTDQDGRYAETETLNKSVYSLAGGENVTNAATLATDTLEPGQYEYTVASENESVTGVITVQQPATARIQTVQAPTNVTRGETANVTVGIKNGGDVAGNTSITLSPESGNATYSHSVFLRSNETTNVSFAVNTTNHSMDSHNYTASTTADTATVSLTVQDSQFEVSGLEGPNVLYVGDTAVFSATVTNTGTISGTQSVQHRIDSNGDDRPEAYGVNENVTLAPGESTRVSFAVEYTVTDTTEYPVEPLALETYVYGIYSEDTRASTAMSVKPAWAKDSSGGSGGSGSVSNGERASLDEITQDKYGLYYDEVSGETKRQIEEIHERQPFADGLVAAEVRTREEIARQDYGADVKVGDKFEFTGLDSEVQQQVEAEFDGQFESESGDRIESWDELALDMYGTTYENLDDSQQAAVRESYQEQFE